MYINRLEIRGAHLIIPALKEDRRGSFQKTFDARLFAQHGMDTNIREQFDTRSHKDVIRGMHFQTPPSSCAKYISVSEGTILDVILDLRVGSPTFGEHITVMLNAEYRQILYIPHGCAHGFKAISDHARTNYLQTASYDTACDAGIRFDSFGMDWGVAKPITSDRDLALPELSLFNSPFRYRE